MRHGDRGQDRAASAAARRGVAARWADLSLRGKGLIVVAIPMSALLAAAPVSHFMDPEVARGRARVFLAALFSVGLGAGVLATLVFTNGLVRRVERLSEAARDLAQGRPVQASPVAGDEIGRLRDEIAKAAALRTPLNAILGFGQLLAKPLDVPTLLTLLDEAAPKG